MNTTMKLACIALACTAVTAHADEPAVKRSTAGVCYERGSRGYADTGSYKGYESLDACLSAGGRRPNTKGWGVWNNDSNTVPTAANASSSSNAEPAKSTSKKLFDTNDGSFVKKTRDGLCLAADNPQYQQIQQFSAYRNLKDCVDDGGHAP